MRLRAEKNLLALPRDVWPLLAEPRHLSDWWPGYTAVQPDRRGLAVGARWQITRTDRPGLLRRPRGRGLVVITRVEIGQALGWRDLEQGFEVVITIEPGGDATHATLGLEAAPWRIPLEGLTRLPQQALARLHALCQTAAQLS